MNRRLRHGMTLVELVIAISIMAIIAGAASGILTSALQAEAHGMSQSQLHTEGLLAMERMTNAIRLSSSVLSPNALTPSSNILSVTGFINDDGDFYFDDPLFPRIDEDPLLDLTLDGLAGIELVDDDGDGSTDEGAIFDDDEDGLIEEDQLDAFVYTYDAPTATLTESVTALGASAPLSSQVTQFEAFYEAPERIRLTLTLTGPSGESVTFVEYAFPRNALQWTGKRVR